MGTGLPEKGQSDGELLSAAIKRAGGARALARFLRVTPGRISQMKGGDPMPPQTRLVLEFALGARRGFTEQDLPAKGSGNAPSGRVEGDTVPEPVRIAQGKVWQLFKTYGEDSKEWRHLVKFLEDWAPIAPVASEAVTSRPSGQARRKTAQ